MKVNGVACWEILRSPLVEMRKGVDLETLEGRSKYENNKVFKLF
jgi:hypothetical protein